MKSRISIILLVLGGSAISITGGYLLSKSRDRSTDATTTGIAQTAPGTDEARKTFFREMKGRFLILNLEVALRPMTDSSPIGWGMSEIPEDGPDEYVVNVSGRHRKPNGSWERLYIDASVFANLYNIRWETVKVREEGPSTRITFSGADAGASYRAELLIKDGLIASKRVESGEFPQNFREETVFTSVPVTD